MTLFEANGANLLVLDREAQECEEIVAQAAVLHAKGVRIRTLSLFYDEWLGKLPVSELERISLLFDINEIHRPVYARDEALPRLRDRAGRAGDHGRRGSCRRGARPVRQPRTAVLPTAAGRERTATVFTIHKFRTMRPSSDISTWTLDDDPRVGAVGRTLRRLHIDELPQMWNVLRRDLSIVGPRPEQPHYVEMLTKTIPFYEVRHLVRPGITGWAQVNYDYGSTDIDALEKLQYEFFYLRHQNLNLDLRIIGRTLRTVFEDQGR